MNRKASIFKLYKNLAIKSPVLPMTVVLIIVLSILFFGSRTYVDTYKILNSTLDSKKVISVELGHKDIKNVSENSKVIWYINRSKDTYVGEVIKMEKKDGKNIVYIGAKSGEKELEGKEKVTVEIQTGKENILKNMLKLGR